MNARTLNPKSSLSTILSEIRYSASRTAANPLTAVHTPTFLSSLAQWKVIQTKEVDLIESASDAQALIDEADENLDDFCSRLSKAILVITKDDRTSTLYTHHFGTKTLSEFRRPMLGQQLNAMRPWVTSLASSPYPTLQAMSSELTGLIDVADKAIQARDDARQQARQFRDVGERRQFVDDLNATRKAVYGDIAKLPFTDPSLPSDFASRFFRVESGEEAPTLESAKATVTDLQEQLADAQALVAKLQAEADAEAQAAQQQAANENALDTLEAQIDALTKQAEALKQKLGKSKK